MEELKPHEKPERIEDIRPDWNFMKQLKAVDKRLDVKFNGEHFVITQQTEKYGAVNIWKVVDERGGFRQPDRRDLEMIKESNIENVSPDEKFNLVTAYMERFKKDERDREKDNSRHVVLGNKIQLAQWFNRNYGSGKGNSAFRRVNVRPKTQRGIIIP
jgi:hypothetical protein